MLFEAFKRKMIAHEIRLKKAVLINSKFYLKRLKEK